MFIGDKKCLSKDRCIMFIHIPSAAHDVQYIIQGLAEVTPA